MSLNAPTKLRKIFDICKFLARKIVFAKQKEILSDEKSYLQSKKKYYRKKKVQSPALFFQIQGHTFSFEKFLSIFLSRYTRTIISLFNFLISLHSNDYFTFQFSYLVSLERLFHLPCDVHDSYVVGLHGIGLEPAYHIINHPVVYRPVHRLQALLQ